MQLGCNNKQLYYHWKINFNFKQMKAKILVILLLLPHLFFSQENFKGKIIDAKVKNQSKKIQFIF